MIEFMEYTFMINQRVRLYDYFYLVRFLSLIFFYASS